MATDDFTGTEQNNKAFTQKEMALIEAGLMPDGTFADRIFEAVEASPPIIEEDQVTELEKRIQGDVLRRMVFALGSKSGAETCKKIKEDRGYAVMAAGILSELPALQARYQSLVEMFNALDARLCVALCVREDLAEIEAEGKALMEDAS
jgi:hypothetical protein